MAPRPKGTVRMSSKGQVVLPADVRRALNLTSGRVLRLERDGERIVLTPLPSDEWLDDALRRLRAAAKELGGDAVEELHQRRREERERERRRAARRP